MRYVWDHPVWLLWLAPFIWATNVVSTKAYADVFPPATFTLIRWIIAFVVLLPFTWQRMRRQMPMVRRNASLILFSGAFGMGGYSALAYMAMSTTSAATVAFINSALPLIVPLATLFLARETIHPRTMVGIVVSFLGVVWIIIRGEPSTLHTLQFNEGEILVTIAVTCYAIYSVLVRRKPAQLDLFVFIQGTIGGVCLVLLPFSLYEIARGQRMPSDADAWAITFYIGTVVSLLATVFWNRCIVALGATITGVSYHLLAFFAPILAYFTIGEQLTAYHVVGLAFILAGFFIATTKLRSS